MWVSELPVFLKNRELGFQDFSLGFSFNLDFHVDWHYFGEVGRPGDLDLDLRPGFGDLDLVYSFSSFAKYPVRRQCQQYIQNPGIFRIISIFRIQGTFRTLSNIYHGRFCKNSYLANFSASAGKKKITIRKFLKLQENGTIKKLSCIFSKEHCSYISQNGNPEKFPIFSPTKAFLIFLEMEIPKKILYISGNGTFLQFRK